MKLWINGKLARVGDTVIYCVEQVNKTIKLPAIIESIGPKRVTISIPGHRNKRIIMPHRIEGYEIPVADLDPDLLLDLRTLEQIQVWCREAAYPEYVAFRQVQEKIQAAMKKLRERA